ncbi:DUF2156 domain-containing protein [Amycolatopsis minnesotensis]|uniref:bifunctional lysylphosphatidylglycerol flippase/synthetase MprF n=1 Tax=Amycolatopsis minnesotensis TaxID=337894 RepID=UPI0031D79AED
MTTITTTPPVLAKPPRAERQVEYRAPGAIRRTATLLRRRLPFTTIVVAVMLVLSVASGTLWSAVEDSAMFPYVAYGLPSTEAGHWWTLLVGPFFAVVPLFYLPMVGSFALFVGFAEWRLGTRRTIVLSVATQIVSVLAAVGFLALVRDSGWDWAERAGTLMDVGYSGGALAMLAIAAAAIRSPWRLRIRAGLVTYVSVAVIYVGSFADLVHFFAVVIALPLGPKLVGRHRAQRMGRPSMREWRLFAGVGLFLLTVAEIVMWLVPAEGPFGSSTAVSLSGLELTVLCAVVIPMLNGLRRGSKLAWWCSIGLTAFVTAQGVLLAGLLSLIDLFSGGYESGGLSLFFVDNLLWTAELMLLIVARGAFRVPSRRTLRQAWKHEADDSTTARKLLARHGGGSVSWMSTWPENSYFVSADGDSYLAYRRHARVAVALGDPIAPDGGSGRTVTEFVDHCDQAGLVPCVFSATADVLATTKELGWQQVQVAEDTLIDLETLQFRGKAWQDVRSALNKAAKEGIEFRLVTLAEQPRAVISQVRAISEEWISDKGMPEMGFTLGGVDEAMDPRTKVGLAIDTSGTVHGVTSWMPVHRPSDSEAGVVGGWTLDMMRRRTGGFRPVMEFLIASSCLAFKESGATFVSLSGAPLARSADDGPANAAERVLDSLGSMMEPYYGFRSLHAFKAKFKPRCEPMYLAFRDEADLPRIGIALGQAYLPNTGLWQLAKLARTAKR